MHELEVPLALAGVEIDGEQRLAEQVVAGPVDAEVVARRLLDGQIDGLELRIDGDLRPDARVARVLVRAAQPALGAELAAHRHRVEDPEPLAGARVEAAHVALDVARAVVGFAPVGCAAPTMMTFFATIGVACRPISLSSGSRF